MGRRYSVDGTDTTGTNSTALTVVSAATVRPKLYDIVIGSDATPADQATEFTAERFTAAGTATAVTPQALDPGDPSALASSGETHTVEPTYTANAVLLKASVNQRATFRWVANPGGELVCPATAANGIGVKSVASTGTYAYDVTIHFEE